MQQLAYLFIGLPYLVAPLAALALCAFLVSAYRSPTAGLVSIGVVFLLESLLGSASLGLGINVFPPDLVSVAVGFVALLRFLFSSECPRFPRAWFAFVAAVAISFVLGFDAYGTLAGVALRPNFYAIAAASYLMTFAHDEAAVRRVVNFLCWVALGVVLIVCFRWVVVAIPIDALLPPGGFDPAQSSVLRVIGSEATTVLAQALVVGLFYVHTSGLLTKARFLLPAFAVVVLLLQHRSVWAAVLAAVAARFALPAAGRKGSTQLLSLAVILAALVAPALLSGRFDTAARDVQRSASRAVALTDTAQARLDVWRFAFNKWRNGGPRAVALGLPFGTSMDRYSLTRNNELRRDSFQAHSYYIQTLFSTGLLGLGATLWMYAHVLRRLYRRVTDPLQGPTASLLLLLLVVQLSYYVTYGIHYIQGLVLGVAAAYVMTLRNAAPAKGGASAAGASTRRAQSALPVRGVLR